MGKMVMLTNDLGKFTFNFPGNDYRVLVRQAKQDLRRDPGWLVGPHATVPDGLSAQTSVCVVAKGFENQQVGHWESVTQPRPYGSSYGSSGAGCPTTYTVQRGTHCTASAPCNGASAGARLRPTLWVYSRPNPLYAGDSVCIP